MPRSKESQTERAKLKKTFQLNHVLQTDLATALGIKQATVSRILSGKFESPHHFEIMKSIAGGLSL